MMTIHAHLPSVNLFCFMHPYNLAAYLLVEEIARSGWQWCPALSLLLDGLDQAAEEAEEVAA